MAVRSAEYKTTFPAAGDLEITLSHRRLVTLTFFAKETTSVVPTGSSRKKKQNTQRTQPRMDTKGSKF
jgi:hypothetical protein